jgi:hypothetical protein
LKEKQLNEPHLKDNIEIPQNKPISMNIGPFEDLSSIYPPDDTSLQDENEKLKIQNYFLKKNL